MDKKIRNNGISRVKRLFPSLYWKYIRAIGTAIVTPFRFSIKTGHWKSSLRQAACSQTGEPLPWYTYPAIEFLAQQNYANCIVLEFGGGQSTHWWSARAHSVTTIEESEAWFKNLKNKINKNVQLHYVPADICGRSIEPVKKILNKNNAIKYDIIIVDGHLRQELALLAFDYLSPGGAIILDNSEGYGMGEAIKNRNCRKVDFYGFAPGVSMRHCTSLVYVDDCFLLRPEVPIVDIEDR